MGSMVASKKISPCPKPQILQICDLTWKKKKVCRWKRVFADVSKLKILRWEGNPGLSEWTLMKVCLGETTEDRHGRKKRRQRGYGVRDWSDEATSQGMSGAMRSWKKQGQIGKAFGVSMDFPTPWFWTSGLQTCEKINLLLF